MHDERVDDATSAWIETIALLTAAADRAVPGLGADELSLALGAGLVACDAMALLPRDADERVEAFVVPAQTVCWSIRDLIAAADHAVSLATHVHPSVADAAGPAMARRPGRGVRAPSLVPEWTANGIQSTGAGSEELVRSRLRALRSEAGA